MKTPVPKKQSHFSLLIFLSFFLVNLFLYNHLKAQCPPPMASIQLDVNNINTSLFNGGDMWWDGISKPAYEYPKGSGINALTAGGIWLTGIDTSGSLMTAAMLYRPIGHDFFAGPISSNGTVAANSCSTFDRFWKVDRTNIQQHIIITSSGTPLTLNNIDNSILYWPAKGNPHFTSYPIQEELAPFIDVNNNGIYDPEYGDYPHIKGDEAIFWVMNDLGGLHTSSNGQSLGVEIHALAYAYSNPTSPLHDATFYEYKVIKKTPGAARDFYFGLFVDPDIGFWNDDYVGCDTLTESGFAYNGDAFDEDYLNILGYGEFAPMISTTFLNKEMTGFVSFGDRRAMSDPSLARDFHGYMQGKWLDNSRVTHGGNGYGGTTPTKFMYPSNPASTNATSWNEIVAGNTPGDRRYIQSSGPYTLNQLDTFTITYSTIAHPTLGNYDINNQVLPRINEIRQAFADSIVHGNNYFNPLGFSNLKAKTIHTYPNPTAQILTIDLSELQQVDLQLIDLNGRVVFTKKSIKNSSNYTLDMSHLPDGIYFLHVISNQKSMTQKVIKQNSF